MEDSKNLAVVLNILEEYWGTLTPNITDEQLSGIEVELTSLENRMKQSKNTGDMNDASKDFFQVLKNMESFNTILDFNKLPLRSGSLPDLDEDIRIKIINYCVIIKDRIKEQRAGAK